MKAHHRLQEEIVETAVLALEGEGLRVIPPVVVSVVGPQGPCVELPLDPAQLRQMEKRQPRLEKPPEMATAPTMRTNRNKMRERKEEKHRERLPTLLVTFRRASPLGDLQ